MFVSIKAAKKVTVRRFAKAAVVAAILSTLGATQGIGGTMPDNCQQNLNQCSLQIWGKNTFPYRGYRNSITFSNGATLTCTSNGPNVPRSCTLTGDTAGNGGGNDNQGAASPNTDSSVLKTQSLLSRLGYYSGPLDGKLDDATTAAIKKYQRDKGLPIDGKLDDVTRASLGLGAESPSTDSAVLRAQSLLSGRGYYSGPLDGKLDSGMTAAIKRYQRDKGLPMSGKLDDVTRASLGIH